MEQVRISFEFFPAKTPKSLENLIETARNLEKLQPDFFSVTYGAGGSTQDFTLQTLQALKAQIKTELIGHLTCVGKSKQDVNAVARHYADIGVRHILALRGDGAGGIGTFQPHPDGYRDAADLIGGLKTCGDFAIAAAAYPEKHPDSSSLEFDIKNMKTKNLAGATQFITQFFFNMDAYFRFAERVEKAGITAKVRAGILPITNFETMCGFAAKCGTEVPQTLHDKFASASDDDKAKLSIDIAVKQCEALLAKGFTDLHFYTLNRSDLVLPILEAIGVRQEVKDRQDKNIHITN